MMPKKKRISIIICCSVLVFLLAIAVFAYLVLKTDTFVSKEELFAKYIMQGMNNFEFYNINDEFEDSYTSELEANIKYTENINTTDENKDNKINNLKLKINSNINKNNNYEYRNVLLGTEEQDLIGFEYINAEDFGLRLNGIQQFIVMDKETKLNDFNLDTSSIDLKSIFKFSESEKETLFNTYKNVLNQNVKKEKYFKQKKAMLTVDNKDVVANSYYIKLTLEEYNNLCIKMLEQLEKDEIILSKIDLVEEEIKNTYPNYKSETTFRESFVEIIEGQIKNIKDNNIGNSTVKIAVYEKERKPVRISIEKTDNNFTIDFHENNTIKIHKEEISDITEEKNIKITSSKSSLSILYEESVDSNITRSIDFNYEVEETDNGKDKIITANIANEKYEIELTVNDNIKSLDNDSENLDFSKDSIKISSLNKEQLEMVTTIIESNIEGQINNFDSKIGLENCINILQNLGLTSENIDTPVEKEVTETEKTKFNSKFKFFESKDLKAEDINKLIDASKNDLENVKVLLKDNNIEELNMEKLESNTESSKYLKTISEILLVIKEDYSNEEDEKKATSFIEKNKNAKYTVSLQYNNDEMVELIRIKIQED